MTLSRLGASLVAIGDHSGYWINPEGFNPFKLAEFVRRHGAIAGYPRGEAVSRQEFFGCDCEILVPAALELQLGSEEAKAIRARLVAEAANGPTDLEAERILAERGIELLPDILVNSGGVIVSYFEWLQNKRAERWDRDEVRGKLERRMLQTWADVRRRAQELDCDRRTACYALALERVSELYRRRGIWP
jgi:glutamate dehydrogenase (NAD(P)+)